MKRRPKLRRRAGRAECLREAKQRHKGKPLKVRRFYRDCIRRRGVWRH
jgi:hypothetical protein